MSITVRKAKPEEYCLIFGWRNDPLSISTSRSGTPQTWEVMQERFSNPGATWFIGEVESTQAGAVGFKRGRSGVFETSVMLSPDFRGRKLSSPMLSACLEWMRNNTEASFFSTEIKNSNIPSIRMFERCGFTYVHPTPGGFGAYCTGLKREIRSDHEYQSIPA